MSINIPSELEQFVEAQIASGKFRSRDEIVCEALRLLRSREESLDRLRGDIRLGIDQIERGDFATIASSQQQSDLLDRVKTRARKLAEQG